MNSVSAFTLQVLVFLSASFTVSSFNLEEERLRRYDELIRAAGVSSLGIPTRSIPSGIFNPQPGICNALFEQGVGSSSVEWSEGNCPADLVNLIQLRASELSLGRWMLVFDPSVGVMVGQISRVESGASPIVYEFNEEGFPPPIPGGYSEEEIEEVTAINPN